MEGVLDRILHLRSPTNPNRARLTFEARRGSLSAGATGGTVREVTGSIGADGRAPVANRSRAGVHSLAVEVSDP